MSSYYDDLYEADDTLVYDDEDYSEPEQTEVRCPAHCMNGLVEVHGQETDCVTCEGMGTILV